MRRVLQTIVLMALAVFWFSWNPGSVQATTITFGDNSIVWPGWEGTTNNSNQDVWGIPNILGGSMTIDDNNRLTTVTIQFAQWGEGNFQDNYQYLRPGDLFIDLGADTYWDYAFSFWDYTDGYTGGGSFPDTPPRDGYGSEYGGDFATGLKGIGYNLNGLSYTADIDDDAFDLDASSYFWSNEAFYAPHGSYPNNIYQRFPPRWHHPVALNPNKEDDEGNLVFTSFINHNDSNAPLLEGWGQNGTNTTITFSNLNIDLSGIDKVAIGWTQSCANDILHETMPVPEPGTLLLLGIGLAGLLVVRRRMTAH